LVLVLLVGEWLASHTCISLAPVPSIRDWSGPTANQNAVVKRKISAHPRNLQNEQSHILLEGNCSIKHCN
jgi:hypothetical protein